MRRILATAIVDMACLRSDAAINALGCLKAAMADATPTPRMLEWWHDDAVDRLDGHG